MEWIIDSYPGRLVVGWNHFNLDVPGVAFLIALARLGHHSQTVHQSVRPIVHVEYLVQLGMKQKDSKLDSRQVTLIFVAWPSQLDCPLECQTLCACRRPDSAASGLTQVSFM